MLPCLSLCSGPFLGSPSPACLLPSRVSKVGTAVLPTSQGGNRGPGRGRCARGHTAERLRWKSGPAGGPKLCSPHQGHAWARGVHLPGMASVSRPVKGRAKLRTSWGPQLYNLCLSLLLQIIWLHHGDKTTPGNPSSIFSHWRNKNIT